MGVLFGISYAQDIKSNSLRLFAIMFACMIALGAAQTLMEKVNPKAQTHERQNIDKEEETLVSKTKEQVSVVVGTLLAMTVPGLLFYIDQQSGTFSQHVITVATVITILAIGEHYYAWRVFKLKYLGKALGLLMLSLTIFFAFVPVFQLELYTPASQLGSELLLMIYLPFCWYDKSRRRKPFT